jgi:hypothetical protein
MAIFKKTHFLSLFICSILASVFAYTVSTNVVNAQFDDPRIIVESYSYRDTTNTGCKSNVVPISFNGDIKSFSDLFHYISSFSVAAISSSFALGSECSTIQNLVDETINWGSSDIGKTWGGTWSNYIVYGPKYIKSYLINSVLEKTVWPKSDDPANVNGKYTKTYTGKGSPANQSYLTGGFYVDPDPIFDVSHIPSKLNYSYTFPTNGCLGDQYVVSSRKVVSNTKVKLIANGDPEKTYDIKVQYFPYSYKQEWKDCETQIVEDEVSVTPSNEITYTMKGGTVLDITPKINSDSYKYKVRLISVKETDGATLNNVSIIVAGGGFSGKNSKTFDYFAKELGRPIIGVHLRGRSAPRNTIILRKAIKDELDKGKRVLVIGHCMGAMLAFNIANESEFENNKCLANVYIDPPYRFWGCKVPILNKITGLKQMRQAICDGIQDDEDTIDWTGGRAFLNIWRHDPFNKLFTNMAVNQTNLAEMLEEVRTKISQLETIDECSLSPQRKGSDEIILSSAPVITSVSKNGVRNSVFYPGDTMKITGKNFSPNENTLVIENVDDTDAVFVSLEDVDSKNGEIIYKIPNTPLVPEFPIRTGIYNVYVNRPDSDYSAPYKIMIQLYNPNDTQVPITVDDRAPLPRT